MSVLLSNLLIINLIRSFRLTVENDLPLVCFLLLLIFLLRVMVTY